MNSSKEQITSHWWKEIPPKHVPKGSQGVPKFFPKIFSSQAVGDVCPKRIPKYKVMGPLPKACPKEGAIMWMSQAGPNVVSQTLPKTDRFANTSQTGFPKVCQGVRIVRNRVPCTDTVGCISNVHWSSRNNDEIASASTTMLLQSVSPGDF